LRLAGICLADLVSVKMELWSLLIGTKAKAWALRYLML